jgi:hypothetical protein
MRFAIKVESQAAISFKPQSVQIDVPLMTQAFHPPLNPKSCDASGYNHHCAYSDTTPLCLLHFMTPFV